MSNDPFIIAGTTMSSRLFVGSARYPNQQVMLDAMAASAPCMVTMSIRRISLDSYSGSLVDVLSPRCRLLPNTSGCVTARDAILTAELAREALQTNWVKLELIGDRETLYPDVEQLVHAADELVRKGFVVLPYCNDDPVTCEKLAGLGCAAVMPLGAPIGSGLGILNPYNIETICRRVTVPVILDAGIGTASDAARAMELGCSGVLLNTAIARADRPVAMAAAMRLAVAAKARAHRRQDLLGEGVLLARAETRKQRRGQDFGRHRLVDRGIDGPAAFAGILDKAGVVVERVVLGKRRGGEIEQPGWDHAAAPPDLRNVGDIQIEAMVSRQRVDIGLSVAMVRRTAQDDSRITGQGNPGAGVAAGSHAGDARAGQDRRAVCSRRTDRSGR